MAGTRSIDQSNHQAINQSINQSIKKARAIAATVPDPELPFLTLTCLLYTSPSPRDRG